MYGPFQQYLQQQLSEIDEAGLTDASGRSPRRKPRISKVLGGRHVLNMCANNYLGLAQHPQIEQAVADALSAGAMDWPVSVSSAVRDSCIAIWNSRLVASWGQRRRFCIRPVSMPMVDCSKTLLTAEDAVISDELNHASIIDGVRLCKAQRYRYKNSDMADLESQLATRRGVAFV